MANLQFRSHVGHQPWFFVPDTGSPGGSAVLIGPGGKKTPATETQVTAKGDRVGFRVPFEFTKEGDYVFVVTQDDVVTEYEVEVLPAEEPAIKVKES